MSSNRPLDQQITTLKDYGRKDAANWARYANGPAENQSPLNTLYHVANTARNMENAFPTRNDQVELTRRLYKKYDTMANRGGLSRKMRSYRNKSNKSNKRNKRTTRTRRGKRRLH
jgi:hypothetical protein